MARTVATLPGGSRITDHISLGVIAKTFPVSKVHSVLATSGKTSIRQRDLPAHVVVYYVIALALYMQSSYREVLRCMSAGKSRPRWTNSRPICAAPGSSCAARHRIWSGRNSLGS